MANQEQLEISDAAKKWMADLFATIDRMDAQGYSRFFEESGSFRFANHPPSVGREAIAGVAQMVFDQLESIEHRLVKAWEVPGDLLLEGVVIYTREKDGERLEYPFFSVFEMSEKNPQLIKHYRSFVDASGLFAA